MNKENRRFSKEEQRTNAQKEEHHSSFTPISLNTLFTSVSSRSGQDTHFPDGLQSRQCLLCKAHRRSSYQNLIHLNSIALLSRTNRHLSYSSINWENSSYCCLSEASPTIFYPTG